MMKTTNHIEPHSQEWWDLKQYEDTYEKPRVQLNNALSWFDTDELRQLKKDAADSMVLELRAIPKPRPTEDPNLKWVQQGLYDYQLKKLFKHYTKLEKRIDATIFARDFPAQEHSDTVTQQHIDNAREYPIEQLLDTPIRRGMTNCPFHQDKTPSFSVKKYNRYKCFSCGEAGDTIDLYMKLHNVDFLTAVRSIVQLH